MEMYNLYVTSQRAIDGSNWRYAFTSEDIHLYLLMLDRISASSAASMVTFSSFHLCFFVAGLSFCINPLAPHTITILNFTCVANT